MNNKDATLIQEWRELRDVLETHAQPLKTAKQWFNDKPTVSIQTDPYDPKSWPGPWQLILENCYCDFSKILGIYHTLRLTTRFSNVTMSIYIMRDKKNQTEFAALILDNVCVSYNNEYTDETQSFEQFDILKKYDMKTKTHN